ncbi:hypothetical protein RUE5091_00299 [Ruegeria denitrificans]|uniref:Secreted protein n=1 Tax=Ruegeria denitrificans TaxID=1715692 RepID=A0A0P1I1U9_9RHOB|nr:hypothetical protein [Ruegeria denitrificans]CUJ85105.1 hypothetical protein RUE5091_00299 [Ruegeria denitrificans]
MYSKFPFNSLCAALVLAAHFFGTAASAQNQARSASGFGALLGSAQSVEKRSKPNVQKHYVSTPKHHFQKQEKPKTTVKRSGIKRLKFGRYSYTPHRQHGRSLFHPRQSFHYKRY